MTLSTLQRGLALTLRNVHTVPAILANGGENAATKFLEFFAARIRNLNTRDGPRF
jgi:hypothetical protein